LSGHYTRVQIQIGVEIAIQCGRYESRFSIVRTVIDMHQCDLLRSARERLDCAFENLGESHGNTFPKLGLLGQSFAVLKSDKELIWLPVLSAVFCLAAAAIILGIGLSEQ
jgi:hypothetical protein